MFKNNWWKAFGPGILFAGTAIGVSHLVQSTRAGAEYGYALVWAVLLANFFKYPFFEFGSRFAQATETNLLQGYLKLGKWPLWLYLGATVLSMFTVTGAVSYVTTALLANMLGLEGQNTFVYLALALYIFCILILLVGKYKALDKFVKVVSIFLILSTLVAFVMVLLNNEMVPIHRAQPSIFADKSHWIFIIALMGWMPTAVDLSAWSSIWTMERMKETGYKPTLKQSLLDFKIGYLISVVLALVFLTLGAELLFYQGESFPNDAPGFVNRLIGLFTGSLGDWSYFIIVISAFSVMLSTTITVFDGYGRAVSESVSLLFGGRQKLNYTFWLLVIGLGGLLVITVFLQNMKLLVDVATSISFLIAPVVAYLNYKLIYSKEMPLDAQPGKALKLWSIAGLIFLTAFSFLFIYFWLS